MTNPVRINPDRMLAAFNELASIGATAEGGVHRPTFSEAHLAARRWFRQEIERSGLEFHVDGAGNHSAVLPGERSGVPTLLIGSHLDSVPYGGRFDGALGVMAALEVLRTVRESGIRPRVRLEAIDFTDEEGTLVGLLGSAALSGHLTPGLLQNPRGGREHLVEGLARAGLSDESLLSPGRPQSSLAEYLELHIEQGKRLERSGIDIGVVAAIVGISSYRLSFIGRADHAGSTTMQDRLDASLGAAAFTLAAREQVLRDFPDCVVNIGNMEFTPGAFNIVPARVDMSLEFDLHHLNVLDDGRRLWMVDWEYGGPGNPLFDVASFLTLHDLGPDPTEVFLESYGRLRPADQSHLDDARWLFDYVQWLWYRSRFPEPGDEAWYAERSAQRLLRCNNAGSGYGHG